MVHALEWFLFGMFVWGCCIVLQAFQRRVAPEGPGHRRKGRRSRARQAWRDACGTGAGGGASDREAELQTEIDRLRKRIETLEAIVTDRKFQWDQELNS